MLHVVYMYRRRLKILAFFNNFLLFLSNMGEDYEI